MMQFLETVLIILLLIASVALIVLFFIYTGLDKRRFRIERQLDKVLPLMKKWLERMRSLSSDGVLGGEEITEACSRFLSTKKLMKRLDALEVLSDHADALVCRLGVQPTETQAETYRDMQELSGMLHDFFSIYPLMADEYNKRLDKPVISTAGRLMRFKRAPDLSGLE